jgi:hypothetical protein
MGHRLDERIAGSKVSFWEAGFAQVPPRNYHGDGLNNHAPTTKLAFHDDGVCSFGLQKDRQIPQTRGIEGVPSINPNPVEV